MRQVRTKKSLRFDDVSLLYRRFLQLLAILPFEGRDFNFIVSRVLFIFFFTSSIIYWSMFVVYIINLKAMPAVDTICETVLVIGVNLRHYWLLVRRADMRQLLLECEAIWDSWDDMGRRTVLEYERKMRKLFMLVLASCIFINILYPASAIVATISAHRLNDTHPKILPYKWYVEDPTDMWPGYNVIFAIQVVVVQNSGIIATTVDSATPFLIIISCGYFKALSNWMTRITEQQASIADVDLELVKWSRMHQRTLEFCTRIDKLSRTLFLTNIFCNGYTMSLIGIKLASADPDRYKYVPVLFYSLGELYIVQWAPEYLINESSAVSSAVYFASVTWMKRRFGRLLVTIIARAQRPVRMTAGGVFYLSLENFGSMLTSAFQFFTVLRNFNV